MTARFATIVVGVDGRQGGRDAIALSRVLAGPDTEIVLVHAWITDAAMLVDRSDESRALLEAERAGAGIEAAIDEAGHSTTLHALQDLVDIHHAACPLLILPPVGDGSRGRQPTSGSPRVTQSWMPPR